MSGIECHQPCFIMIIIIIIITNTTTTNNNKKKICDTLRLTYDVPDLLHVVASQWQQWLGTPDCLHP